MSDLGGSKAAVSTPIANENPETLIGTPTSGNQSTPPYGDDKASVLEKNDGSTTTLGDTLAAVDAATAKTADLSADGSEYSGDVSAATVQFKDAATGDPITVKDAIVEAQTATTTLTNKTAKLAADGSSYTGDVNKAVAFDPTNGQASTIQDALSSVQARTVTKQTAPADLTAAPTASDFNGLVSLLKQAGVLN